MRQDLVVQQQVKSVWQHMVGVICLNLTTGTQVKKVLPKLFKRYPNATSFLRGRESTQRKMLKDLGMSNVRTKRLRTMSLDFLSWDRKDATKLHGIGKYGSDSYEIFWKGNIPENVQDKELKRYIKRKIFNEK